ncbi:hypothetical protein ACUVB7_002275 [Providencia rettgeri]
MNAGDILKHLSIINTVTISNTTYWLATNKKDPTGENRFIFIDLSHQSRTQINYIANITSVMNQFNCGVLMLLVNSVTPSFYANLNASHYILLDANSNSFLFEGFEFYPLLNQDHDTYSEGLAGWVPSKRKVLTQQQIYDQLHEM